MKTRIKKYYVENRLESYFKTIDNESFTITYGFSVEGKLFDTVVIYKNLLGKPYAQYEKVENDSGFYRRINSVGALSIEGFDSFRECIKHPGESLV